MESSNTSRDDLDIPSSYSQATSLESETLPLLPKTEIDSRDATREPKAEGKGAYNKMQVFASNVLWFVREVLTGFQDDIGETRDPYREESNISEDKQSCIVKSDNMPFGTNKRLLTPYFKPSEVCDLSYNSDEIAAEGPYSPRTALLTSSDKRFSYYVHLWVNCVPYFPRALLCFHCKAFHPGAAKGLPLTMHPDCPASNVSLKIGPTDGRVHFWWTYGEVRDHRLGARIWDSYPLKFLKLRSSPSDGWKEVEIRPKVLGGRLLLRCISRSQLFVYDTYTGSNSLPASISACLHSENCAGLRQVALETVAKARTIMPVGGTQEAKSELCRCPWCPSEFRITVRLKRTTGSDANRLEQWMTVTHWLDLGKCLSCESREWVCVTRPPPAGLHLWSYLGECETLPFSLMGLPTIESRFEGKPEYVTPRTWWC